MRATNPSSSPASTPNPSPGQREAQGLGRGAIALLSAAAGLSVASIYYNQPMLGILSRVFERSEADVAWVAVITQIGYALGLLFLSPLGDRFERRGLIVATYAALAASLGAAALAPDLGTLLAASLVLGMLATVAQQVVPMAAHLAGENRRGQVVGTVMAGLFTGILLSRAVSGLVSQYWSWRIMFGGAALAALGMGLVLAARLPRAKPVTELSYPGILASLARLTRTYTTLRRAAAVQALLFGGFISFWANLAFFLEQPPFSSGSSVVGLLSLMGVAGVLAAPLAGRLADRGARELLVPIGAGGVLAGFVLTGVFQSSWIALLTAVLLMDVGIHMAMIANQSRVFGLDASARSRLNTVYMTTLFVGGALGTAVGSRAFAWFGWTGVCGLGVVCALSALAVELAGPGRTGPHGAKDSRQATVASGSR